MTLAWRDWYRMAVAQLELLRAQRLLRDRPVGSLVKVLEKGMEAVDPADLPNARSWARAVRRAAHHGVFRPKCLVRSLALVRLLDRHGIPGARIRAGVLRDRGSFFAHAWVELGEEILTDAESYVAQFEPWADLRMFEDLSA